MTSGVTLIPERGSELLSLTLGRLWRSLARAAKAIIYMWPWGKRMQTSSVRVFSVFSSVCSIFASSKKKKITSSKSQLLEYMVLWILTNTCSCITTSTIKIQSSGFTPENSFVTLCSPFIALPPALATTDSFFVPGGAFSRMSYERNHMVHHFLSLTSFIQCNAFEKVIKNCFSHLEPNFGCKYN